MTIEAASRPALNLRTTTIYEANASAWLSGTYRRALNEGGTRSSKTWSCLQLLYLIAKGSKAPLLISVVSESMPHLKRGAIRDWFNIIGETQGSSPHWNQTDHIYRMGETIIEFFPADDASKLRGAGRDILFINEANNVSYEAYRELEVRTKRFIFLDWNPVSEFWAHEHLIGQPENCYIHSTYKDALEVLPREVVQNIESNRERDPNWWNVYGLGLVGKIEGLVYPHFEQVDELPLGAVFYGLDWGFASDPTVLVKNVLVGDKLYSQEMFFDRSGLTNGQIAQKLSLLGIQNEPIYPDPDEPKSAQELREAGFNICEPVKGVGSVAFGIQKVNNYHQFWTKDSLDCIKEQRNFRYLRDKATGLYTDRTTHQWSHGLSARRYACATYQSPGLGRSKPRRWGLTPLGESREPVAISGRSMPRRWGS